MLQGLSVGRCMRASPSAVRLREGSFIACRRNAVALVFQRMTTSSAGSSEAFNNTTARLRRQRTIFEYDSTRTEADQEIWRLRVTGDKEIVEVVNPHLSEEQIEQLSSQVGQIMQMDL